MGDNAKHSWEWHNNEVGKGYQARGVVRQPGMQIASAPVLDLSKPQSSPELNQNQSSKKESEKSKKDSKAKKSNDKIKKKKFGKPSFNPLLQLLATRLSDKTMSFS